MKKTTNVMLILALTIFLSACDDDSKVTNELSMNTNTGMAHQKNTEQKSDEEIYKELHSK